MKNRLLLILMVPVMAYLLCACANTASVARIHPEAVKGLPNCTECHTDSWGSLNHQAPDFLAKHSVYAASKMACASCHEESYCAECHAHKEEIKPSQKNLTSPERFLPHRGDYLSLHKIEGKINPASCVKCHGRQNNERCITCHK